MSTYVWCEDSGSGLQFWREIFKTLNPNIIVETKTNNSRLRIAAGAIENDGNEYYILMDSFIDNADVLREIGELKKITSDKQNVHIADIRSFEFVLLSFQSLIQWVFEKQDNLKEARRDLIRARDMFTEHVTKSVEMNDKTEFEKIFPYAKTHNNEQIATELLFQITRNTGFETNKSKLGDCFTVNCCEWLSRRSDDLCGLNDKRLSADDKKKLIVNQSILKTAFEKVGLK